MNDLQVFTNERLGKIRAVKIKGEPYFVGKDVADALGYTNSRKALADHVDDEDKGVTKCDTLGGKQTFTVINESGVYSLIFGSKLPKAKEFKRWVTSEVLPSIRKTGGYNANQNDVYKAKRLEVMMMNAKARIMKEENKKLELMIKNPNFKSIAKTYSASEVGVMLGVSANKIGRLATANDLKTEEYGDWFKETINDGSKEVSSFRYNEKGVEKLRELLNPEE